MGNGNPSTTESFQADSRSAFHGLCLVIIRSEHETPGKVILKAEAEGVAAAEVALDAIGGIA